MKKSLRPRSRISSFGYAAEGILTMIRKEPNARIHLLATGIVIVTGILRQPSRSGWIALVFAIALVWIAELFNTAIEMLCDLYVGETHHPVVKRIKDISAAAVLIASAAAIAVAAFVFL